MCNNEEQKQNNKKPKSLKLIIGISSAILILAVALIGIILFTRTEKVSEQTASTISQQTQEYLDSLPADTNIRVVGLMDEPLPQSSVMMGTSYEYIVPLLDDYVEKSDGKVTVEYINPATYPTIISGLDPENKYNLTAGDFVITYNGKIKVIKPADLISYDSEILQGGDSVIVSVRAEHDITNAMFRLTSTSNDKKAYFLTGLENTDDHERLSTLLDDLAVDSEDLPASEDFEVPNDCGLLVMSGINQDITESMTTEIIEYLENDGKLLVSIAYSSDNAQVDLTNLNELLNRMNLFIESSIVHEENSDYQLGTSAAAAGAYFIATLTDDYSSFVGSANLPCTCYAARPITELNTQSDTETSSVLTTTDSVKTLTIEKVAFGEALHTDEFTSKLNVAMYSTFTGTSTKVYVFGTETFTADQWLQELQGTTFSNNIFIKSVLTDLVGAVPEIDIPILEIPVSD